MVANRLLIFDCLVLQSEKYKQSRRDLVTPPTPRHRYHSESREPSSAR